jgi:hypothetical protein
LRQLTIDIASAVRNGAWLESTPKLPLESSARKESMSSSTTTDKGVTIFNLMRQPQGSLVCEALASASFLRASSSVPTM